MNGSRRECAPAAVPVGVSRSSTFIPELESLRGIAVLLVVAFHVDVYAWFPFAPPVTSSLPMAFVRAGHTGVDLFFVLSGFLLSLPFLADVAGGRRVRLRDYVARRALRILPLYWTAVAIGTVLSAGRPTDLARALPYLLFLNAIPAAAPDLNPYGAVWWSLATEIQFYVLLPLLLLGRAPRGRTVLGLFLAAYVAAYVALVGGAVTVGSVDGQIALHNSVFGRGPLFLAGMIAAAAHLRYGETLRERLRAHAWVRSGGADALLLGVLVAMAFFLRWLVSIGPARQQGAADQPWHVVNGVLWAGVLLLLLWAPLRSKPIFSNAALERLGVLSYSIYLIHAPFVFLLLRAVRRTFPGRFVGWSLPTAGVLAVLVLACCGLSTLTYRLIERPFLARKARFDA